MLGYEKEKKKIMLSGCGKYRIPREKKEDIKTVKSATAVQLGDLIFLKGKPCKITRIERSRNYYLCHPTPVS